MTKLGGLDSEIIATSQPEHSWSHWVEKSPDGKMHIVSEYQREDGSTESCGHPITERQLMDLLAGLVASPLFQNLYEVVGRLAV